LRLEKTGRPTGPKSADAQLAKYLLRSEVPETLLVTSLYRAALRHLGYPDIHTTRTHHVGKKRRMEVSLSPGAGQLKTVE
jgi:hypothetical protein